MRCRRGAGTHALRGDGREHTALWRLRDGRPVEAGRRGSSQSRRVRPSCGGGGGCSVGGRFSRRRLLAAGGAFGRIPTRRYADQRTAGLSARAVAFFGRTPRWDGLSGMAAGCRAHRRSLSTNARAPFRPRRFRAGQPARGRRAYGQTGKHTDG